MPAKILLKSLEYILLSKPFYGGMVYPAVIQVFFFLFS